ncbi:MAG: chromosome condensation protein CrcB [Frankiales bacterium]|nr:chromosome condensation protein CrcB [Frankiales bacterium]
MRRAGGSADPDAEPGIWRPLVLVALGGVVGSLARYGLGSALPGIWTTFGINVAGSFLLGALVVRWPPGHWSRPLLGSGVLGGFTTMSGLAVQAVDASPTTGTVYLAATLLAGVAAAALGTRT